MLSFVLQVFSPWVTRWRRWLSSCNGIMESSPISPSVRHCPDTSGVFCLSVWKSVSCHVLWKSGNTSSCLSNFEYGTVKYQISRHQTSNIQTWSSTSTLVTFEIDLTIAYEIHYRMLIELSQVLRLYWDNDGVDTWNRASLRRWFDG